jgi:hypothetical protein
VWLSAQTTPLRWFIRKCFLNGQKMVAAASAVLSIQPTASSPPRLLGSSLLSVPVITPTLICVTNEIRSENKFTTHIRVARRRHTHFLYRSVFYVWQAEHVYCILLWHFSLSPSSPPPRPVAVVVTDERDNRKFRCLWITVIDTSLRRVLKIVKSDY